MKLFTKQTLNDFKIIKDIQLILAQIILYSNPQKISTNKAYGITTGMISTLAEELDLSITKFPKDKLTKLIKNKKQYILEVLDFYEKNNIWFFPIYLSPKTSNTCINFAFRIINKYSNYNFDSNSLNNSIHNNFEKNFYKYISTLKTSNILIEISSLKNSQPGDIILYQPSELKYNHIGLIFNTNYEILSKFGKGFLHLTPYNNHYFTGKIKIFRLNDQSYYNNFKTKFIPIIERLKMTKQDILTLIEKLENS